MPVFVRRENTGASSSTLSWSLRTAVTVWHGGPWLGCRSPDAGRRTPRMSEVSTRRTNDNCEGARSGHNRSSSGGLVPRDPWEQEGSDRLLGGRGMATSPASSLDSAGLLVLAVKMACSILRVECPVENGSLRQSLLENRNLGS